MLDTGYLSGPLQRLEQPMLQAAQPLRCFSMNQGKQEEVKQEMARVNSDILGISELKWTRMGKFNSDDHYIYYCGQESPRRNGVAQSTKESKMQYSDAVSK